LEGVEHTIQLIGDDFLAADGLFEGGESCVHGVNQGVVAVDFVQENHRMAVHLPSRLSHNLLRHLLLIDGHRQLYHELFENEDFRVGGDLSGLVI